MLYNTLTTEALVCGVYDRNTSDRSYLLFTKKAGMIYANARSAREEKSKQRYSLQEFSLVRVSLIKVKRGWRIGSVEAQKNYYQEAVDRESRGSVVSVFRLLRRFVKGEEVSEVLFDFSLKSLGNVSKYIERQSFVLVVIQVKILRLLGYVDKKRISYEVFDVELDKVSDCYSLSIEERMNSLYAQAILVSHL